MRNCLHADRRDFRSRPPTGGCTQRLQPKRPVRARPVVVLDRDRQDLLQVATADDLAYCSFAIRCPYPSGSPLEVRRADRAAGGRACRSRHEPAGQPGRSAHQATTLRRLKVVRPHHRHSARGPQPASSGTRRRTLELLALRKSVRRTRHGRGWRPARRARRGARCRSSPPSPALPCGRRARGRSRCEKRGLHAGNTGGTQAAYGGAVQRGRSA
jgi:hypothetical protein